MTANNYRTIFELGFSSFPWPSLVQPLIFLGIGLIIIRFFKSKTPHLVVGVFVASMGSLFFLISLVSFLPSFLKLRSAYVSGKSVVVEGVVQNFLLAPTLGPARESFSVNGISFSYNALDDTPCFHDAPLHGGPIREGLDVRIHYYEGCIQRLEVSQRSALPPSH